jgi:NAD(P)-dependent dehydrogenase (short-subunit alcohol dehydrogenase family)
VLVVDRDPGAASLVAADVGGWSVMADVGDPSAWNDVANVVRREVGRLDVAFLNAGIATGEAELSAITDDAYLTVMRVNVDGIFLGLRAVAALMERGGAIVATASTGGLAPVALDPVYRATKHAVIGLVRSFAPQLAARGIALNAVCPGVTDTPLVAANAELVARIHEAGISLLHADDIARAVIELILSGGSGEALVCQAGRAPAAFPFPPLPSPGETIVRWD